MILSYHFYQYLKDEELNIDITARVGALDLWEKQIMSKDLCFLTPNSVVSVRRTNCIYNWSVTFEVKERQQPTIYIDDKYFKIPNHFFLSSVNSAIFIAVAKPPLDQKSAKILEFKRRFVFVNPPSKMQISVSSTRINPEQEVVCFDAGNPLMRNVSWVMTRRPFGVYQDFVQIKGPSFYFLNTAIEGTYGMTCKGHMHLQNFNIHFNVSTGFNFTLRFKDAADKSIGFTEVILLIVLVLTILFLIMVLIDRFKTMITNFRKKMINVALLFLENCKIYKQSDDDQ